MYRIAQQLDIFRLLSFYYSSVGFYLNQVMCGFFRKSTNSELYMYHNEMYYTMVDASVDETIR